MKKSFFAPLASFSFHAVQQKCRECEKPTVQDSRIATLAFFRPNFKKLASFQVGWPKKF